MTLWALDNGHAGESINGLYDTAGKRGPGAPKYPAYYEGKINRLIAGMIAVEKDNVQLIAPGPMDPPLKMRSGYITKLAKHEKKFPVFGGNTMSLSLHTNAAPGRKPVWRDDVEGFKIFHYPGSVGGTRFAQILEQVLKQNIPMPSRGITTTKWLHMVRKPKCPAVLLEMLFHTNRNESKWIKDGENQLTMARAIAHAMKIYEGMIRE